MLHLPDVVLKQIAEAVEEGNTDRIMLLLRGNLRMPQLTFHEAAEVMVQVAAFLGKEKS